MLLPESVLRTISYYESKTLQRDNYQYYDYITIHFNSFLKRRKQFKWQCIRVEEEGQTYIKTTTDFKELKKQLDEYFKSTEKERGLRL